VVSVAFMYLVCSCCSPCCRIVISPLGADEGCLIFRGWGRGGRHEHER
jgi:uncharacterized protein (UPF0261 family)